MNDFLQITTAACTVAVGSTIAWFTIEGLVVTGVWHDLSEAVFQFARYLRRKWRQNKAAWREIWRTNKDWGNRCEG